MDLNVWSADWGLASVDPQCLSMMTYAKFAGAPVNVQATDSPFWSPNGRLPVFTNKRHPAQTITSFRKFVANLQESGYSADYNLTARQKSELATFGAILDEKLSPALLHVFWIDAKNQLELSRPWFAQHMGLPWSLYYPNQMVRYAQHVVTAGHFEGVDDVTVIENAVYKGAEECLTILSRRLGDQDYFFGQSPSSIDAVMYGYLAPLLKAPLPNPGPLQNHLKACGNLVSFIVRITQNYFSQTFIDYEKVKAEKEVITPVNWGDWLRPLMAVTAGGAAMTAYAYGSGLLDMVVVENSPHDDDED